MINFVSPPEWIHIESVADGSSDQSGAEWQQVDFNLPPNTLKAVAEFIVSQIRPRNGIHLSEYGKGSYYQYGIILYTRQICFACLDGKAVMSEAVNSINVSGGFAAILYLALLHRMTLLLSALYGLVFLEND
ncbi:MULTISPECIES: hypothetical protein [Photorhabdus]|uniref:Uncharacterized protein n=2 Tax=Photorhabdus TaxID=29487 RepID=A0AAW6BRG7_9GAMM|nr:MULTISPECIES: hypothetical protein [Photorhabdus]EYU13353.1 hypothetical protein BA1DRAFT_04178 [Photorhabdus aegyptia]MDB6374572.1 hypothetical protein [Photorhabdus bodei]